MKNHIILLFTFTLALISSCEKNPTNGDLDGQWQLLEISNKTVATDADYDTHISKKDDRIYWCFQLDLLMIRSKENLNGQTPYTFARFNHSGKNLDLTSTYIHFRDKDELITETDTRILEPMGITGNAEKYVIQELNSKRMVLTTAVKRLTFRKF